MSKYRLCLLFYIISISLFLSSCTSKNNQAETVLKKYIQTADSLTMAGKGDSAINVLLKQRAKFKSDNPQISAYYVYMAGHYNHSNIQLMALYADSALSVFADKGNIEKYPTGYFKALMIKGDASIAAKQYQTALEYYDKAKKTLINGTCDDGDLAGKIANIYFNQQNYRMAAKYWVAGYDRFLSCPQTVSAQRAFFLKQSLLDNIGVSYQKAEMDDSAAYYYKADLNYINKTDSAGSVEKYSIIPARIVVYDNLGGLALKQGDVDEAEKYLTTCVAISYKDVDGLRIPPYIKLAELYLKTGEYNRADSAFNISKNLLSSFGKDNPRQNIEWNRLYAQYLFALHKPDKAYQYQSNYIRLKDSLDKTNAKIHRLDIDRELNAIQRDNLFEELEHQEKVERIYTTGVTIAVILLLGISIFIIRILRESRKNHKSTTLHNEQLQQALEELERANENIIRIMRIMAHDLRNPLAGMIGLANAIIDDDDAGAEENKHMLRLIETTGVHSLEMINELLKTGLADENEPMPKKSLDLKELLSDSVELLRFKAAEKQQQIIFDGGDHRILTAVNQEKIWRVFNNLIVNAIKFSHISGVINVIIKEVINKGKGHILIAVADNGIGIAAGDAEKIFEMFTTAKRVGTDGEQPFGLGLSISKKIIENHGGKIWVESKPGSGSTFFITLPL